MWRKLGRVLALLGYAGAVLVLFGSTAYLSFNQFVRRGVMPVPDVVGLTLQEARNLLLDQGLRVRRLEDEDRFDDAMPPGLVLQHDPAAGSLVKKGSAVDIILSRGQQLVEVPDLSSQAIQAAQVNLAASGLALGRRGNVYTDVGAPGSVVRQHPLAGTLVDRSTPIDVMVSLENTSEVYVMPDLVNRRGTDVRLFFERQGFRVGSVKYEPYEGVEEGVVLRQYPLPGHPLRRHDVISLVVAASSQDDT